MAFTTFHHSAVKMQPMGGNIKAHAQLEQEGRLRIEHSQIHQQTHGGAAVSQHVQHGPKAGALVKSPGSMAIKGVKEATK